MDGLVLRMVPPAQGCGYGASQNDAPPTSLQGFLGIHTPSTLRATLNVD
jgi:hypothetical protein